MRIEDYYLMLRNYYPSTLEQIPFEVTLEDVSVALDCTKRNTNLLLAKMEDRNWINWIPGRGRGNRSTIVFIQNKEAILFSLATKRVQKGDIKGAFQLLELQGNFTKWMEQQMGFVQDETTLDVLRFPFYRPILELDPAFVTRRSEAHMVKQIFDTLLIYNKKTRMPEANLCHYWQSDSDHKIWRFHLRKGLFFHDGKPLTAHDVKFTLERILSVGSPHVWMTEKIKKIKVLHDYRIEIELVDSNSMFDLFLCSEGLSIVPSHLSNSESFSRMPVGSGAFSIINNDSTLLKLKANDYYFKERAYLDVIEMWVWPDYHGNNPLSGVQVEFLPLTSENHTLKGIENLEIGATYLVFNLNKKGPQQDSYFREALHVVLDRYRMIQQLGGGRESPASGFIPTFDNDGDMWDMTEAHRLLKQSQYAGESVKLYTYEMKTNEENADWIRDCARDLGVVLEVEVLPINELKKSMWDADMILAGEVFDHPIELGLLHFFAGGDSFIQVALDCELKQLHTLNIEKAMEACNQEDRLEYLRIIETELKARHAILFLYHSRQTVYHHDSLKGISLNALGWMNYRDLWIDRTS
ncbi:SgrR family transcriptional regulator [Peribacillus acanthi]|uniref:SgrR family transcriptional regulator n=1 Tax=Peribacillus acanthi TaxID=2171554 RepID=UPI000D3EA2CE|nr:SgrR family transcriptional regulator [Peribacillus acanthi]